MTWRTLGVFRVRTHDRTEYTRADKYVFIARINISDYKMQGRALTF